MFITNKLADHVYSKENGNLFHEQSVIRAFIYGPDIFERGLKKLSREERIDAEHWNRLLRTVHEKVRCVSATDLTLSC